MDHSESCNSNTNLQDLKSNSRYENIDGVSLSSFSKDFSTSEISHAQDTEKNVKSIRNSTDIKETHNCCAGENDRAAKRKEIDIDICASVPQKNNNEKWERNIDRASSFSKDFSTSEISHAEDNEKHVKSIRNSTDMKNTHNCCVDENDRAAKREEIDIDICASVPQKNNNENYERNTDRVSSFSKDFSTSEKSHAEAIEKHVKSIRNSTDMKNTHNCTADENDRAVKRKEIGSYICASVSQKNNNEKYSEKRKKAKRDDVNNFAEVNGKNLSPNPSKYKKTSTVVPDTKSRQQYKNAKEKSPLLKYLLGYHFCKICNLELHNLQDYCNHISGKKHFKKLMRTPVSEIVALHKK